jgi:hypothetical protein
MNLLKFYKLKLMNYKLIKMNIISKNYSIHNLKFKINFKNSNFSLNKYKILILFVLNIFKNNLKFFFIIRK